MTAPDWYSLAEAEKVAVQLGWLEQCPHIGLVGTQCSRAARHDLPHLLPIPAESAETSPNGPATSPKR